MSSNTLQFSEALHQLEMLVRQMEEPCDLEVAMQHFEEGMRLSAICSAKLKEAELRVQVLESKTHDIIEQP